MFLAPLEPLFLAENWFFGTDAELAFRPSLKREFKVKIKFQGSSTGVIKFITHT